MLSLFTPLSEQPAEEIFETLAAGGAFRLERIVSTGQITPEGQWYDQPQEEWVALLSGAARLLIEGGQEQEMRPGDLLQIPAHCRHRVTWTDPQQETVWLAIHYEPKR